MPRRVGKEEHALLVGVPTDTAMTDTATTDTATTEISAVVSQKAKSGSTT